MFLSLKSAEAFVRKTPNWSWDGWTMEQFVPNPRAMYKVNGAYRNNQWGFLNKYELNGQGKYVIRHNPQSIRS